MKFGKVKSIRISFRDTKSKPSGDIELNIDDFDHLYFEGIKDSFSFNSSSVDERYDDDYKSCEYVSFALKESANKKYNNTLNIFERIKEYNDIEFFSLYGENDRFICFIDVPYDSSVNRGPNSFQRTYYDENKLCVRIEHKVIEKIKEKYDDYYLDRI